MNKNEIVEIESAVNNSTLRPNYNIQMISKLTGIGIHTLRIWERRYKVVEPERNQAGHRQYSEQDLEKLQYLAKIMSLGGRISEYANLSTEQLKSIWSDIAPKYEKKKIGVVSDTVEVDANIDKQASVTHLLLAIEGYKLDIISHEIHKLKAALTPRELVFDIFRPLMTKVGEKVSNKELTIAQEHAITSLIKSHIGSYTYGQYDKVRPERPMVALTTPEGQQHEFGILFASLLCYQYGVNFIYLGPHMPAESVLQLVDGLDVDIVLLGAIYSVGKDKSELDNYFSKILNSITDDKQLWFGGSANFSKERFEGIKNFDYISTLEVLDKKLAQISEA